MYIYTDVTSLYNFLLLFHTVSINEKEPSGVAEAVISKVWEP